MTNEIYPFDIEGCAAYIETLVQYDEPERALLVLDNLPAIHRDNPPPVLARLRSEILAALVTPHAYMSSDLDSVVDPERAGPVTMGVLRGKLLEREVERYNRDKLVPHIVDVGPGEYHFPIAMMQLRKRFTYWDLAMDKNTQRVAHPIINAHRQTKPLGVPTIFAALEIIEHLPDPRDLAVEMHRHCGGPADRIHLSTPRYTFNSGRKDWRKPCGLPHLRAYTPNEFLQAAQTLFPGYHWQVYNDVIMSIRGVRADLMTASQLTDLLGG